MNNPRKPKMSAEELVRKMRDEKGITFNYMSEQDAVQYLRNTENYMRAASYRKNYTKVQGGKNDGKYEHLDFAYLKELSEIDKDLRAIILRMCLEIEHAQKVRLIRDIEDNPSVDGYSIVYEFINSNMGILSSIEKKTESPFIGDLIHKYFFVSYTESGENMRRKGYVIDYASCPAWVLVELLTYGEFLKFYDFYYGKNAPIPVSVLHMIQSIRNGAAHNNCFLSNLNKSEIRTPTAISKIVKEITVLTKSQRKNRLAVRCILEFVTLLYVYKAIICDIEESQLIEELKSLFYVRMLEKKNFFLDNSLLVSNYKFACLMIDCLL